MRVIRPGDIEWSAYVHLVEQGAFLTAEQAEELLKALFGRAITQTRLDVLEMIHIERLVGLGFPLSQTDVPTLFALFSLLKIDTPVCRECELYPIRSGKKIELILPNNERKLCPACHGWFRPVLFGDVSQRSIDFDFERQRQMEVYWQKVPYLHKLAKDFREYSQSIPSIPLSLRSKIEDFHLLRLIDPRVSDFVLRYEVTEMSRMAVNSQVESVEPIDRSDISGRREGFCIDPLIHPYLEGKDPLWVLVNPYGDRVRFCTENRAEHDASFAVVLATCLQDFRLLKYGGGDKFWSGLPNKFTQYSRERREVEGDYTDCYVEQTGTWRLGIVSGNQSRTNEAEYYLSIGGDRIEKERILGYQKWVANKGNVWVDLSNRANKA